MSRDAGAHQLNTKQERFCSASVLTWLLGAAGPGTGAAGPGTGVAGSRLLTLAGG